MVCRSFENSGCLYSPTEIILILRKSSITCPGGHVDYTTSFVTIPREARRMQEFIHGKERAGLTSFSLNALPVVRGGREGQQCFSNKSEEALHQSILLEGRFCKSKPHSLLSLLLHPTPLLNPTSAWSYLAIYSSYSLVIPTVSLFVF